jgi:hypothetical protein
MDTLQGFTRAAERPVPLGFWEQDLAVMKAVEDVARALHGRWCWWRLDEGARRDRRSAP